jgi:hypothetical protein
LYRIYLPENYDQNSDQRYPVIYYFHGYGGRYKWDGYDLTDDINYPGNGRKDPPFVMEWENYVKRHNVIIVTWDGYEPNLHEGKKMREGIKYGNALPYDYVRAHEKNDHHWGWDYRMYFRDLVKHVDKNFRTIADRDHRAVTGLSMGGLTSYYIAGASRDLISSVSAFDPADNFPLYGPKGKQAVFPILEMYRPLKGLSVRLTATDGDWLKYNDRELKQMFEAADLSHFESHIADYPDHWTADTEQQLDFHMREFGKPHPIPEGWSHICPAFSAFQVWDYNFQIQRSAPALTILENVSPGHMKVLSRDFIPDGPIVQEEIVSVSTDDIYSPNEPYQLVTYNLSDGEIKSRNVNSSAEGRLVYELNGGGHLIGINGKDSGKGAKLQMVFKDNQEYFYFEKGRPSSLDFKLVNVGTEQAGNIEITASSNHPYIEFGVNKVHITNVGPAALVDLEKQFKFTFNQYSDSAFVGAINFEVRINGELSGTQKIMVFPVPDSEIIANDDMIILDGRTVNDVSIYAQGPNAVQQQTLSGGKGNGNGKLERGEQALLYVRLPRGMGENDLNTFHRTYLINHLNLPFIDVKQLDYMEKLNQASASSVSTVLSVSKETPVNYDLDLWLKIESLYNDERDTTSRATIYAHKYDYRHAKLKIK